MTGTSPRRPKWIRLVVILVAVGLVVSGIALWAAWRSARHALSESRCDGHSRFVRSEWMDTTLTLGKLAVRGCMVDDLLDSHDFRGMTRREVVAIIGEPPPSTEFKDYDLVYWLGPERGLIGTDSEFLVMRLGPDGRVASVELVTG